jgi:hypothetical protein
MTMKKSRDVLNTDIRYLTFRLAGYPAKTVPVSGASLVLTNYWYLFSQRFRPPSTWPPLKQSMH